MALLLFPDFVQFFGESKFTNVTNGVTPRRWLQQANPQLNSLIAETLGSKNYLLDLDQLQGLKNYANNADFQAKWMSVKHQNKARLAYYIKQALKIDINPDALFDVQCKRLHEYKRQFMNILGVIHRYWELKSLKKADLDNAVPHVVIFSGKSAPGYYIAKLVIKLINSVADIVNNDPDINGSLKVIFIPNYNVSVAEILIPASDISQHISTAGTEASGTSNMKFVLSGGLIIGTVDGANIEIGKEVGDENIWLFGTLAHEVEDIRHEQRYHGVKLDPKLEAVIQSIQRNDFGDGAIFGPLLATLTYGHDYYLVSKDFES
ncbi:Non-essential glycogen phosphorylase, partial [Nowakowskiella sp. JEL0078]